MSRTRRLQRYGPWAVVTGASSGIGQEMARYLARAGLDVAICARRKERLTELAAQIQSQGRSALAIAADLGTRQGCDALLEATRDLDVGLAAINAGVGSKGHFAETPLDEILGMITLNCTCTAHLVHAFAGRLLARAGAGNGAADAAGDGPRGGIVITSSTAAFQGIPLTAAYAATKGFELQLAEALYWELRPRGVDVIALCPGATDTEGPPQTGVDPSKVPNTMPPDRVAAAAFERLGRQPFVVPGFLNQLGAWMTRWVPRRYAAKIAGRMISRVTGRSF